MKLLTMKFVGSKGNAILISPMQYFVKLETMKEFDTYEWFLENLFARTRQGETQKAYYKGYWDCYMTEKLDNDTRNEDIYYYIVFGEPEPAIGEEYTDADGLVWERVE